MSALSLHIESTNSKVVATLRICMLFYWYLFLLYSTSKYTNHILMVSILVQQRWTTLATTSLQCRPMNELPDKDKSHCHNLMCLCSRWNEDIKLHYTFYSHGTEFKRQIVFGFKACNLSPSECITSVINHKLYCIPCYHTLIVYIIIIHTQLNYFIFSWLNYQIP